MNLRDKILNASDIKSEVITIEEWDVELKIKGLNGKERADFLSKVIDQKGSMDLEKATPMIVVLTAHDPETDEKVFTIKDLNEINKKASAALDKVSKKAFELSGLGEEAQKEAKND